MDESRRMDQRATELTKDFLLDMLREEQTRSRELKMFLLGLGLGVAGNILASAAWHYSLQFNLQFIVLTISIAIFALVLKILSKRYLLYTYFVETLGNRKNFDKFAELLAKAGIMTVEKTKKEESRHNRDRIMPTSKA